jgi:polyisoprenoid-binding protein YceI
VRLAVLLALVLLSGTARAETRNLPLDPAHAEVGFRTYAFGMVPMDGTFSRFSGVLVIDPAAPGTCRVDISVEVASLHMPDPAIRDDVLSPNLLDAVHFPTLAYSGACAGDGVIEGVLTLHGVARPLRLTVAREAAKYRADASLRRREWGITGRPLMAGSTVRIRVSTSIPR